MIRIKDIVNYMKLSNESKVSLLVSCIIIIIISQFDTLINALSIRPIIDNVLPLISIITIFLLGSVLSSPIYIWAKGFYNGRLTERHMSIYLRQLTEDEKHALCKYMNDKNIQTKRKYIPATWTNFQIEKWFPYKKNVMQRTLDEWIYKNPSENGYFTIVQYDDGPLLRIPNNTIIYGACSGHIPLPLIYQDKNNTLINFWNEK